LWVCPVFQNPFSNVWMFDDNTDSVKENDFCLLFKKNENYIICIFYDNDIIIMSHYNQLHDYRKKKQEEYEQMMRLKMIQEKYGNLMILNKKLLSIIRIQRYMRRHFFHEPINMSLNEIPGLYRYRCKISQLNMIDFLDEMDDDMIISLMSSLDINEKNEYWIVIDLRIYGEDSNLPIYINDDKYHFLGIILPIYKYEFNKLPITIGETIRFDFNQIIEIPSSIEFYNLHMEDCSKILGITKTLGNMKYDKVYKNINDFFQICNKFLTKKFVTVTGPLYTIDEKYFEYDSDFESEDESYSEV